jgi:hypothetical protein
MKEFVAYEPKTNKLWLGMKDTKTLVNGRWQQDWHIYNGEFTHRPKGNHSAAKLVKNMILLQVGNYLDEFRS